eukprot:CAMPEP_0198203864 /NCGR_PEP_ID=MMETSP1445-20131203/7198_1 /TAXON_ID=36898 /ORGANISM="Pyramimonas sp., Strain CCMP2087" /LENGTH=571 /DNA_ID=CAMNT_0043875435 /DNA_START=133 /DNA_END=1848 /DNA_ORIENTATION=+
MESVDITKSSSMESVNITKSSSMESVDFAESPRNATQLHADSKERDESPVPRPTPRRSSNGRPTPGRLNTPGSSSKHSNLLECMDEESAVFWMNRHLDDPFLSVSTFREMSDGRVLLALIDKLVGLNGALQKKVHLTKGETTFAKIDNMAAVLKTVHEATGLPFPLSALDLVANLEKGDCREMLATVWRLVLHFDSEAARDPLGWVERMKRLEQAQRETAEAVRRNLADETQRKKQDARKKEIEEEERQSTEVFGSLRDHETKTLQQLKAERAAVEEERRREEEQLRVLRLEEDKRLQMKRSDQEERMRSMQLEDEAERATSQQARDEIHARREEAAEGLRRLRQEEADDLDALKAEEAVLRTRWETEKQARMDDLQTEGDRLKRDWEAADAAECLRQKDLKGRLVKRMEAANEEHDVRQMERQRLAHQEQARMRAGACIYCGLSLLSKWQLTMECPEGPWFHPGALDPRTYHMQCCGRPAQSESHDSAQGVDSASNGCRRCPHVPAAPIGEASPSPSPSPSPLPSGLEGLCASTADCTPGLTCDADASTCTQIQVMPIGPSHDTNHRGSV